VTIAGTLAVTLQRIATQNTVRGVGAARVTLNLNPAERVIGNLNPGERVIVNPNPGEGVTVADKSL
jgi:hypothetical protein